MVSEDQPSHKQIEIPQSLEFKICDRSNIVKQVKGQTQPVSFSEGDKIGNMCQC